MDTFSCLRNLLLLACNFGALGFGALSPDSRAVHCVLYSCFFFSFCFAAALAPASTLTTFRAGAPTGTAADFRSIGTAGGTPHHQMAHQIHRDAFATSMQPRGLCKRFQRRHLRTLEDVAALLRCSCASLCGDLAEQPDSLRCQAFCS